MPQLAAVPPACLQRWFPWSVCRRFFSVKPTTQQGTAKDDRTNPTMMPIPAMAPKSNFTVVPQACINIIFKPTQYYRSPTNLEEAQIVFCTRT